MSYYSDKLNAFAGIGAVFARYMGTELLFGLPKTNLNTALLWSPDGTLERLPEFPSWSWAGWKGKVWYGSQHTLSLAPIPAFYSLEATTGSATVASMSRLVQDWESPDYAGSVRPWTIKVSQALSNQKLTEKPISKPIDASSPVSPSCLYLDTFCASTEALIFRDGRIVYGDSVIGGVLFDTADRPSQGSSNLELLVLSMCSASSSKSEGVAKLDSHYTENLTDRSIAEIGAREKRFLPLTCVRFLLVEKVENGACERRGMGEVSLAALGRVGYSWKSVVLQ